MRVLLIKMSSLGDVSHTFPALTDAQHHIPGLEIDWVVEEAFSDIPGWHPAVNKVIPIGWRRWRRSLYKGETRQEIRDFFHKLRQTQYDMVLDAQGLMKSAIVTRLAKGKRVGLDHKSIKEPLASCAYSRKLSVPKGSHAINRLRDLFAQCFGYSLENDEINYGLDSSEWPQSEYQKPYVVFLHGTTWDSKQWPENNWKKLSLLASNDGFSVLLPWGNEAEKQRAKQIESEIDNATVLPSMKLSKVAQLLAHAHAVIGVDTGLSHVSAALAVPIITIYGSTDPALTGVVGQNVEIMQPTFHCSPCLLKECTYIKDQSHQDPPCYDDITPADVWQNVKKLVDN